MSHDWIDSRRHDLRVMFRNSIGDAAPLLEPSARDEITVVLNWTEELKRLVPLK